MCGYQFISGLQSETVCHCRSKAKLYVIVGLPIHYMVYLGNQLLVREDETDCCLVQQKSSEVFRFLKKSEMIVLLSGKAESHTSEPQLVVTCCSYCLDIKLAKQQGAVGKKWTSSSSTMHCSNSCTIVLAKDKMKRKPILAASATAHMQSWSCLRQLENQESKRFGVVKIPGRTDIQKCGEQ